MFTSHKLPFSFDGRLLKQDLALIHSSDWVTHFNREYFEGEWTGVAFRSAGGSAQKLYPDPRAIEPIADTPLLELCPNVRKVIASLQCPLRCVRFLKLAPGSSIREHHDYDLGYKEGQVRLHIPVSTNPDVVFFLDGYQIEMKEGECWYLDLSFPHWVENRGSADRVHLVIDCELNEWLRELIPNPETSEDVEESVSDPQEFERFRQAVAADPALQHRLRQTGDRDSFVRLVVALGRERNYRFIAANVEGALRTAERLWFEKWID